MHMIYFRLMNNQRNDQKCRKGIIGLAAPRLSLPAITFFLLFLPLTEIVAQTRYAGDLVPPASKKTDSHKEAETMKSAFKTLSPYIAETGGGGMTFQRPDNDNKLRSLSLSTSYITTLANLYNGGKKKSWLDHFPVLGIEIQEMDTSDAYQLSSVKLGFFDGQLWVVFEPLDVAGESISLRWQYYW